MYREPPPAPPRPRRSPLVTAGIIAAAATGALLVIGFIALSALDATHAMNEVFNGEAGPPMTDDEIRALLAGPKKDYVGSWHSGLLDGAVLRITADGRIGYAAKRGAANENANGKITSFTDEAFYVMTLRFGIEQPPHEAGGKWTMRVRGRTWERD